MRQIEMVDLEDLIHAHHRYRQFIRLWTFKSTAKHLKTVENDNHCKGYDLLRLFKCLLLQFMEDLSGRELEHYLQENNVAKGFCEFGLTQITPAYSVLSKLCARIGTQLLSKIFAEFLDQLKQQGAMNEAFSFVDASHLIAKVSFWQERDKAIKEKYDRLNNEIFPKVAVDKQVRIACKRKGKYWYSYKQHVNVNMQNGLINKVPVAPANERDTKRLEHVCPSQDAIYADKAPDVAALGKGNGIADPYCALDHVAFPFISGHPASEPTSSSNDLTSPIIAAATGGFSPRTSIFPWPVNYTKHAKKIAHKEKLLFSGDQEK